MFSFSASIASSQTFSTQFCWVKTLIMTVRLQSPFLRPGCQLLMRLSGHAGSICYPQFKCLMINVNIPFQDERSPRGNTQASIVDRLRLGGLDAVLWCILKWGWVPNGSSMGKVAVIGQNELLRDAVTAVFCGIEPILLRN